MAERSGEQGRRAVQVYANSRSQCQAGGMFESVNIVSHKYMLCIKFQSNSCKVRGINPSHDTRNFAPQK